MSSSIYLPTLEDHSASVLILVIPFADIRRLSTKPLKWLRYVLFAICGVQGDMSLTANGPPVNYDGDVLANDYYFTPQGEYHFIDSNTLNDRITSSEYTQRRINFRSDIMERDGHVCVISQNTVESCDAAHLIPRSKGDEYINFIVDDRNHLYNPPLVLNQGINSIENGMFLSKVLHAQLGIGKIAFLKTPNFALATSDIPQVELNTMPSSRITQQYMILPTGDRMVLLGYDVRMTGTGISPPHDLLLDYLYGVAVYKRWGRMHETMEKHADRYKAILVANPEPFDDGHGYEDDLGNTSNDGSKYEPSQPFSLSDLPPRHYIKKSNYSDQMLRAMDHVMYLGMLMKKRTPETVVIDKQKQEEKADLRAQEASVLKVEEWRSAQGSNVPAASTSLILPHSELPHSELCSCIHCQ